MQQQLDKTEIKYWICPKCKGAVSIKLTTCPECGYEKQIDEINTQYEDLDMNPYKDKKPLNS
jgi:ribosomal protein L40E